MTGNHSWSVLDLDDERLGDECAAIVEKLGATWIKARLEFYDDRIEKLFRPTGRVLAEAPTRMAPISDAPPAREIVFQTQISDPAPPGRYYIKHRFWTN